MTEALPSDFRLVPAGGREDVVGVRRIWCLLRGPRGLSGRSGRSFHYPVLLPDSNSQYHPRLTESREPCNWPILLVKAVIRANRDDRPLPKLPDRHEVTDVFSRTAKPRAGEPFEAEICRSYLLRASIPSFCDTTPHSHSMNLSRITSRSIYEHSRAPAALVAGGGFEPPTFGL